MGTKVGLTGITFGDATVQNTAAVTGVTSLTAGSGISLSGSTGAVTVTNSAQGTSYSAGNGLSLSSTTFSVAAPSFNSVGSYIFGMIQVPVNGTVTSGSSYSAGTGNYGIQSSTLLSTGQGQQNSTVFGQITNNLSGSWRLMGSTNSIGSCFNPGFVHSLLVRVS